MFSGVRETPIPVDPFLHQRTNHFIPPDLRLRTELGKLCFAGKLKESNGGLSAPPRSEMVPKQGRSNEPIMIRVQIKFQKIWSSFVNYVSLNCHISLFYSRSRLHRISRNYNNLLQPSSNQIQTTNHTPINGQDPILIYQLVLLPTWLQKESNSPYGWNLFYTIHMAALSLIPRVRSFIGLITMRRSAAMKFISWIWEEEFSLRYVVGRYVA